MIKQGNSISGLGLNPLSRWQKCGMMKILVLLWLSRLNNAGRRTGNCQFERSSIVEELKSVMEKFAASGWDLISIPAQQWLDGKADKNTLASAIRQADEECGSCGCDLDLLYKRALELI